jgi:protein involved in polysaccharide export with SLBB domain
MLVVSACGLAQTSPNPFLTGQTPETQQQTQQAEQSEQNQPSLTRPGPNLAPPIRYDTTITNTSPAREAAERKQELDQQKAAAAVTPVFPLEPDIEFQEFVSSALGARLPIFGHNLFENAPSTFAPLDRVQVTPDYLIGPGDELVVRAWGQISVDYRPVVDRSGAIYIPKVGVFNVTGIRYENLHDYLANQLGRVFKNFELSVTLGTLRSIQVYVVGQAKRPGVYTISSLSSLVDALFASGGPSKRGSLRRIEVKRDGKVVTTFDMYDLIVNGDKSKDIKLMSGDVIYVPPVGPLVALAGSVNTAAIFELPDHGTLADLLAFGGGLANTAAGDHVVVERIDDRRVRTAAEFTLDQEGMARPLQDGDVVRVLRISSRFENAVTLRGNVAVPGRYPWRPGMRVKDLIRDRAFLVPDDYWKRQNQLAVNARAGEFRLSGGELKNDVKRLSAEINWDYAVIQRFAPSDLTPHLLPFNLGRAIDGKDEDNLALQPNDVITIFSQADLQVSIGEQSKFVRLEGEFNHGGVYEIQRGETLRHLIDREGGLAPQAYLYGSEFTRESTRVDQQQRLDQYVNTLDQEVQRNVASAASVADPGAARAQAETDRATVQRMRGLRSTGRIVLELKPSATAAEALPDLVLEDGDRLLVPFRPATVNVIGSVYNSGAFIFKPGKTVSDYLHLAGGPARGSDKAHAFVVRADGSTVGRQQHSILTGRNFDTLRLMPGDTIVVPTKLDRGATLRAFRDWATIFGQLGLAAGGIRTLFP